MVEVSFRSLHDVVKALNWYDYDSVIFYHNREWGLLFVSLVHPSFTAYFSLESGVFTYTPAFKLGYRQMLRLESKLETVAPSEGDPDCVISVDRSAVSFSIQGDSSPFLELPINPIGDTPLRFLGPSDSEGIWIPTER